MGILNYFIIILYFLLANLTTVIISKKTFGKCFPVTIMGCAFSLFFSQVFFKTFSVGFIISILYACFSCFYIIYNYLKKKDLKIVKENYLTSGFISFLVITTVVTIFDLNRGFSHWDEYSHWGEMLKEMIRIDKFYSVSASVLQAHKDYPPLLQLFELFIIKLCGSYKETYAIFALHFIELSLFISVIPEKIKNKKTSIILGVVSSSLLIFLTTLFFDQHGIINSIYNDYFMAVLVAYGMSIVIFSKDMTSKFTITNLCLASSFLLLTKQIGLTLYMMIIFFYFVKLLINEGKKVFENKQKVIRMVKVCVVIIVIPLLLWLYWSNFVKTVNIDSQFNLSDIKLSEIYNIYRGRSGRSDQLQASPNFIAAVKSKNLTTSYIPLSYFQAIALALLLIYIILKKYKKDFTKKDLVSLIGTLIIGAFGYAFVMYCTYVFCFMDGEAIGLASFDRYMSTYVLVTLYIAIMLLMYTAMKENKVKYIVFSTIALFVLSNPPMLLNMYPKFSHSQENIYEMNAKIIRKTLKGNEKIFIVAEDSVREYQYFIKYYANPIMTNMNNYDWPTKKDTNYESSYKKIKKDVMNYDYLYIAKTNKKFIKNYAFVFGDNKVKEGQLYKIKKDGNELSYELIN